MLDKDTERREGRRHTLQEEVTRRARERGRERVTERYQDDFSLFFGLPNCSDYHGDVCVYILIMNARDSGSSFPVSLRNGDDLILVSTPRSAL